MGGTRTMYSQPSLAEQLRTQANEINDRHDSTKVDAVYAQVIKEAKSAAKSGSYTIKIYHDNLSDSQTAKALAKKLSNDGFTCSKVHEDSAYSEHAQRTMLYIDVSW
jgi:hypothetical protein